MKEAVNMQNFEEFIINTASFAVVKATTNISIHRKIRQGKYSIQLFKAQGVQ